MIYVICGPTGSGKTSAAKALSNFFHAPIINADAFQIYKDMNIGTAKIKEDDPYYTKHYLLDIYEPSKTYSVKQYQDDFRKTLVKLTKEYKDIIVCGGTGLYIKAALYDYKFSDEEPKEDNLDELSNEELYEMLIKLDVDASKAIHPNNRKRVIRAIRIAINQDKNKTENINEQNHRLIYDNVRFLLINPPREELYENINQRVDEMFKDGLEQEVINLLNKYDLSLTARQAIGYKEVIDYLDNKIDKNECIELVKKRTRNYAKRQITFFKNQFCVETFDSSEKLVDFICK